MLFCCCNLQRFLVLFGTLFVLNFWILFILQEQDRYSIKLNEKCL
jgi:hypothetical protein